MATIPSSVAFALYKSAAMKMTPSARAIGFPLWMLIAPTTGMLVMRDGVGVIGVHLVFFGVCCVALFDLWVWSRVGDFYYLPVAACDSGRR